MTISFNFRLLFSCWRITWSAPDLGPHKPSISRNEKIIKLGSEFLCNWMHMETVASHSKVYNFHISVRLVSEFNKHMEPQSTYHVDWGSILRLLNSATSHTTNINRARDRYAYCRHIWNRKGGLTFVDTAEGDIRGGLWRGLMADVSLYHVRWLVIFRLEHLRWWLADFFTWLWLCDSSSWTDLFIHVIRNYRNNKMPTIN